MNLAVFCTWQYDCKDNNRDQHKRRGQVYLCNVYKSLHLCNKYLLLFNGN